MARPSLPGGYREIAIGIGGDLLDEIDRAAKARGWSRAAFFRRAATALLAAHARGEPPARPREVDDEDPEVDPEEALDETDEPESGPTVPVMAHRAVSMGRGRFLGRYPVDLTDREIVDELRALVPGGTVVLHRSVGAGHVLAYIDPPEEVARLASFGGRNLAPWQREIGPDDEA